MSPASHPENAGRRHSGHLPGEAPPPKAPETALGGLEAALDSPETGPESPESAAFSEENEDIAPQPEGANGVMEDMATLALNPAYSPDRTQTVSNGPNGKAAVSAITPASAINDAEIMLRVRAGDMSGFDYLIEKYRRPIIHFMFRMVHNQAVAEELAQEVFLRVYRSRETYRAEARFSTWLYRIATNLGVNYARDNRHERSASTIYLDQADPDTGTTPDVADSTPSAEDSLLRRERFNAIRQHVLDLPERQRTAVLMHKYEGMDYKQIGDVLKLSESATKSLLFRAYQTLREKLKEFM
jgi:RNA polymerase sigma-70 factor (ECF subfamily)